MLTPLDDKVEFIVSKKIFTPDKTVKVSQFGELYIYEK